jgi:hypothetical protein
MDKDTSEIAKLTERISKDPKSKLFVPLAEEYKKAGDRDMSIHVLTEGLKNNPGYVTARSLLGKLLFEKGDLSGAQKELEEVVKAIPDNLMAQRKLGDLYVLQDRTADALNHYKMVLSLNPRDQETASLVSDAEAGRDIKSRIPRPVAVAPEGAEKKQDIPEAVQPQAAVKPQPPPAAVKPAGSPPPSSAAEIGEVAEEVLVVEPLEAAGSVSLEQALATENLGFLSESAQVTTTRASAGEEGPVFFDRAEPGAGPGTAGESGPSEVTVFPAGEPGGTELAPPGEPGKAADDFTTDTLAELYISQGFYEKAEDIYERMLVDNPNSQGLKDKLASVRGMAAQAAPAAEPGTEAAPAEIAAPDMTPYMLDEFVPPPQEAGLLEPGAAGGPTAQTTEAGKPRSRPAAGVPEQFDAEFKPVEYVPPAAAAVTPGAESGFGETAPEKARRNISPPRKAPSGRKETIDRLENWLQHIMKEK